MRAIRAFFDSRGMPPSLPLACGRTRETCGNVAIGKNSENPSKKRQKISKKTTRNQRKANENKRNPSNINGMIARKSQLSPDSP
jgi:hypothetical protein